MLAELLLACAPSLDTRLASALISQESSYNQYAIGLDSKHKSRLARQPANMPEAIATAAELARLGYTFSVGLTQIHLSNIKKQGLTWEQAFTPCTSIKAGESIFLNFYKVALSKGYAGQDAIFAALRGYNSGSVSAAVSNSYATSIVNKALNMTTLPRYNASAPQAGASIYAVQRVPTIAQPTEQLVMQAQNNPQDDSERKEIQEKQ